MERHLEAGSDGIAVRGWTQEMVAFQQHVLQHPPAARKVVRPCVLEDGIHALSAADVERWAERWNSALDARGPVLAFVPASGAATRMFQDFVPPVRPEVAERLSACWRDFPFADQSDWQQGLDALWKPGGWASLPKGMVPFFRLADGSIQTALDAHHMEWCWHSDGLIKHPLVFTVPPSFQSELKARWSEAGDYVRFEIQHAETDTLAWDLEADDWFRDDSGSLVFRPGGHGALLQNLNAQEAHWAFLRNVDNVVTPGSEVWKGRIQWRAALGGLLAEWVEERNALAEGLLAGDVGAERRIRDWLGQVWDPIAWPQDTGGWLRLLNRPMRVAAVVRNEGQPGGGPFWVADAEGIRPQVVESTELPSGWRGAGTHFNPVDMVCCLRGVGSERLDLPLFSDPEAFFTAEKVVQGRRVRILERPGLWNGGMAGWLTRFVEVPSWTFSPVKTAWDLLRFKSE